MSVEVSRVDPITGRKVNQAEANVEAVLFSPDPQWGSFGGDKAEQSLLEAIWGPHPETMPDLLL